MIFVNRTYFVLFSETERKEDMPDDAFYRNHGITAREREVMERALAGSDNKTIARELGISVNTVKVHASSIFRKLGVRNRFELVKFARNPRSSTERLGD
jgi:DNA-binding NarL/FixJ family response regulator